VADQEEAEIVLELEQQRHTRQRDHQSADEWLH
jgi:hypothetical protein